MLIFCSPGFHGPRRVAELEKPRDSAALGLVGVDRESIVTSAAGMRHVIRAPADRAPRPGVHNIENQRRMNADCGMQAIGRLPSPVTNPRDKLPVGARRMQRHAIPIARDHVARIDHSIHHHLQSSRPKNPHIAPCRPVPVLRPARSRARSPAATPVRCRDARSFHRTGNRNSKCGANHSALERIARFIEFVDDVIHVLPHEMRQQEAVVDFRAPAHQLLRVRLLPEPRDQRAQQTDAA